MNHFSEGRAVQSSGHVRLVPNALARAEHTALELYGPPGVVIDERLQVLGFRGRVAPYFEPVPGTSDLNVLRWVRSELHADLRRAIEQALAKDIRVIAHCKLQDAGDPKPLRMEVVPISYEETSSNARCLLVSFQAEGQAVEAEFEVDRKALELTTSTVPKRLLELGREIFVTQSALQRAVAGVDAAKEELESCQADERSSWEELQSTRKELDTWKQELFSVRQELTRASVALEYRAAQHQRALDDLQDALGVTPDAFVVTDLAHHVRLLSEAAKALFGLGRSIAGESISVLDAHLRGTRLEELCASVIQTSEALTVTVEGPEGRPYEVRVSPYRALEQQVVGAALVFSVIERRKRSLDPASELVAHASTYLRGLRCPLLLVDSQKCVVWVNDSFCELFRVHMADAVGKPLTKLGARQWFDRTLLAAIEGTLSTGRPFRGHRVWLEVPEKGARTLEASGGRLPAPEGDSTLVLLSLRNARPSEPRVTGPRSPGLV